MRTQLGVLIVEEPGGKVAIQLFEQPDKARESFNALTKGAFERASFLDLQFGKELKVSGESRVKDDLLQPPQHDGWKVGTGPIDLPKEPTKE